MCDCQAEMRQVWWETGELSPIYIATIRCWIYVENYLIKIKKIEQNYKKTTKQFSKHFSGIRAFWVYTCKCIFLMDTGHFLSFPMSSFSWNNSNTFTWWFCLIRNLSSWDSILASCHTFDQAWKSFLLHKKTEWLQLKHTHTNSNFTNQYKPFSGVFLCLECCTMAWQSTWIYVYIE